MTKQCTFTINLNANTLLLFTIVVKAMKVITQKMSDVSDKSIRKKGNKAQYFYSKRNNIPYLHINIIV